MVGGDELSASSEVTTEDDTEYAALHQFEQ